MKRANLWIWVLGSWGIFFPLWADPPPPIPLVPTEGSEEMPPADVGTPVSLPSDQNLTPTVVQSSQAQAAPPTSTFTAVPVSAVSTPSSTSTPSHTAVPVITTLIVSSTPTSTATEGSNHNKITSTATVPVGGIFDYFPSIAGSPAEFVYLKAEKGEAAPRRFSIQCVDFKPSLDGTAYALFESTQTGSPVRDRYLLSGTEVDHIQTGEKVLTGEILMKMPTPSQPAFWEQPGEGFQKMLKASLGSAQVLQKTYPHCLIVEEKDMKGGTRIGSRYFYYANGIGLVSGETYTAGLKLIPAQSFVLSQKPAIPGK